MSTSRPFPGYTVYISRVFNFLFQNLGGHNTNTSTGRGFKKTFFFLEFRDWRWDEFIPPSKKLRFRPDSTLPATSQPPPRNSLTAKRKVTDVQVTYEDAQGAYFRAAGVAEAVKLHEGHTSGQIITTGFRRLVTLNGGEK